MKTLLLTFASLLALNANAALVCTDTLGHFDHGYTLVFADDMSSVEMTANTYGGPVSFGVGACAFNRGFPKPGADRTYTVAKCHRSVRADAGYDVVVSSGGITGRTTAKLWTIGMLGKSFAADLICAER